MPRANEANVASSIRVENFILDCCESNEKRLRSSTVKSSMSSSEVMGKQGILWMCKTWLVVLYESTEAEN
jgi:hypothetical protein